MNIEWILALVGGALIGASVSLMLLWNGRVTGISGILYALLTPVKGDWGWRLSFIGGLFAGGLVLHAVRPESFTGALESADWTVAIAGLAVGFGTVLGSGCTSGHGVCGISRLSPRSIVATLVFMTAGVLSVLIFKKLGVLP
jgi:uncharacterized membrane protein YedE/YeeE